jgi:hypothetical protein
MLRMQAENPLPSGSTQGATHLLALLLTYPFTPASLLAQTVRSLLRPAEWQLRC